MDGLSTYLDSSEGTVLGTLGSRSSLVVTLNAGKLIMALAFNGKPFFYWLMETHLALLVG